LPARWPTCSRPASGSAPAASASEIASRGAHHKLRHGALLFHVQQPFNAAHLWWLARCVQARPIQRASSVSTQEHSGRGRLLAAWRSQAAAAGTAACCPTDTACVPAHHMHCNVR
jgi:hypothetical protein